MPPVRRMRDPENYDMRRDWGIVRDTLAAISPVRTPVSSE